MTTGKRARKDGKKKKQASPYRIIVSLTTIPSRMAYLDLTLRSLLVQTRAPDHIYVCLPKFSTKENCVYPDLSDELAHHELITVIRCDKDHGPATKIIPT